MNKQEILEHINSLITAESGKPLSAGDKIIDSELDSLGMTLMLVSLDDTFNILKDDGNGDEFGNIDIPNITMKGLVKLCILSTQSVSMEQS